MSSRPFVPPQFGAFGKSSLFQVYDKDALEHTARQVYKSQGKEKMAVDTQLVYAPKAQPRGIVKIAYVNQNRLLQGAVVNATLHTDASKSSSLGFSLRNVFPVRLPGVNVSVTETTSEKDFSSKPKYGAFGTATADYVRNNVATNVAVTSDADRNHSVSAAASVGFEGFSVGGDVKLVKQGDAAIAPKSYNAGVAYTKGTYTGALVSDSKFEKIKATVLAANVRDFANVGVQFKADLQAPKTGAPQREVVIGVASSTVGPTAWRGALVPTTGTLVWGVEHRLANPSVLVSATAVFQKPAGFFAPWPVTKFGVGLSVGDY